MNEITKDFLNEELGKIIARGRTDKQEEENRKKAYNRLLNEHPGFNPKFTIESYIQYLNRIKVQRSPNEVKLLLTEELDIYNDFHAFYLHWGAEKNEQFININEPFRQIKEYIKTELEQWKDAQPKEQSDFSEQSLFSESVEINGVNRKFEPESKYFAIAFCLKYNYKNDALFKEPLDKQTREVRLFLESFGIYDKNFQELVAGYRTKYIDRLKDIKRLIDGKATQKELNNLSGVKSRIKKDVEYVSRFCNELVIAERAEQFIKFLDSQ